MLYKHKARFIPVGESVQSASDIKSVEVESNDRVPRSAELKDAKRELSNTIDSYSARNYWEIGDFVSTYTDDTKLSDTARLREFLDDKDWVEKTVMKNRNHGEFIQIKHAGRLSSNRILEDLKDYTNSSSIHMYAEKQSMSRTRVYTEWKTRDF